MTKVDIYGPFDDAPKIIVDVPEISPTRYTDILAAGEWSFDLKEESDPEHALEAIGSWIAWYLYLVEHNEV